jgi:hypothetical protein
MARMGHSSTRAAQIYLHTNPDRDRVVADALNPLLDASTRGTRGAVVAIANQVPSGNVKGPRVAGLSGWSG